MSGSLGGSVCATSLQTPPATPIAYITGNDAYINRTTNTTAKVGTTDITWNVTKHWWEKTSDGMVLRPNKVINGEFNTTTIEGAVQTVAYAANATAESSYNKDQTNNLFVSPMTTP